jgi:hypothetical protein
MQDASFNMASSSCQVLTSEWLVLVVICQLQRGSFYSSDINFRTGRSSFPAGVSDKVSSNKEYIFLFHKATKF